MFDAENYETGDVPDVDVSRVGSRESSGDAGRLEGDAGVDVGNDAGREGDAVGGGGLDERGAGDEADERVRPTNPFWS